MKGGAREGAGRKSTWASGVTFEETTLIRCPKKLKKAGLEILHLLDAGEISIEEIRMLATIKGEEAK